MKAFVAVVAAVCMLAFGGTAIAKHRVTAADMAQFTPGKSSYDDVVEALGEPNTVQTSSNGERTIGYSATHVGVKAETFVPVVGLFAGGARGKVSTVWFVFNSDGKLKRSISSESQIDCTNHLFGAGCSGGAQGGPPPEASTDKTSN
jgi:hypothetical protein